MKIAVIGATGLVGDETVKVLGERGHLKESELLLAASPKTVADNNALIGVKDALAEKPDAAFFATNAEVALEWAEKFTKSGCLVIDKSGAFRQDRFVPLIVPEINWDVVGHTDLLISSPNCAAIQLALTLRPFHGFDVERVTVTSMQSMSGVGRGGIVQLREERLGTRKHQDVLGGVIYDNVLSICGEDMGLGQDSDEEIKLRRETPRILKKDHHYIDIIAACHRVPIYRGHTQSVVIQLRQGFSGLDEVIDLFRQYEWVTVKEGGDGHPEPLSTIGTDKLHVGRIRLSNRTTVQLVTCADNLRLGAATNAVKIMERAI